MHRMRPLFALLALSVTSSTFGATGFDDQVPTEVVMQLLGATIGNARLYTDAPDGFPPFDMPSGMNFLVGIDQDWSQRVILRSRVDHQASIALTYGALLDAGWQLIPMPGMQTQTTGFIDPNQPLPQTQLCHDRFGTLTVGTQSGPGATYVNLHRNVQPGVPLQTCAQLLTGLPPAISPGLPPEIALRQQLRMELQQYLPRLELPNTDGMTAPRGGYGGGGGAENEWEVRATLAGGWSMRRIYEHFADQIEDQDWDRDARVIGDTMASGSWTRTVGDEVELVGNLTVLVTGDESYDLRFRMMRIGTPDTNAPNLGIRGIPAGRASPIGTTQFIRD